MMRLICVFQSLFSEKRLRMSATPSPGDLQDMLAPSLDRKIERSLKGGKDHYVIGVDEAGRGPLAGPVVAAAFTFRVPGQRTPKELQFGVTDSKQVSEEVREYMYESHIQGNEDLVFRTAIVDNNTIDEINILQATFKAMSESVSSVIEEVRRRNPKATFSILIDGNKVPPQIISLEGRGDILEAQCVIKGDSIEFVIAAASICAKVERDLIMRKIDIEFPFYGFYQHKGYPTASHVAALSRHGPCKYHRMTFRPLKNDVSVKKTRKSTGEIDPKKSRKSKEETGPILVPASGREERILRRNQRKEQNVEH